MPNDSSIVDRFMSYGEKKSTAQSSIKQLLNSKRLTLLMLRKFLTVEQTVDVLLCEQLGV